MNITFTKAMTNGWSTWALTDNTLTETHKEGLFRKTTVVIPISDITKLAHIENDGDINVISLDYKRPGARDGHEPIAYNKLYRKEAKEVIDYIFSVSHCVDATEELKQKEKELEKEVFGDHRKRCKVCGHIFCYTFADQEKNFELQEEADKLRKLGELEWWGTSMVAGSLDKKRAEDLEAQIIDYSKCPKCGSRELVEVTDEELENSQNAPQISPADELKKYKELLDMGAITQEEFDTKKKQLLGL